MLNAAATRPMHVVGRGVGRVVAVAAGRVIAVGVVIIVMVRASLAAAFASQRAECGIPPLAVVALSNGLVSGAVVDRCRTAATVAHRHVALVIHCRPGRCLYMLLLFYYSF